MDNDNVSVQYELSEEVWNKVVVDAPSHEYVNANENSSTTFVVEYKDQDFFMNALNRFDGMVEYKVL